MNGIVDVFADGEFGVGNEVWDHHLHIETAGEELDSLEVRVNHSKHRLNLQW